MMPTAPKLRQSPFWTPIDNQEIATILGVDVGSPIFLIERTSYAVGGRPVDYERLHYRGDQTRFVTRLQRKSSAMVQDKT